MKTRTNSKRLLSMLLALMMVLALLPTTAFAVETVTSVSATVTAPVAGAKPSFTATSGDPAKYDVTIRYWTLMLDSTTSGPELTAADTFIAGETYGVYITVTAKEGYALDTSTTRCVINEGGEYRQQWRKQQSPEL